MTEVSVRAGIVVVASGQVGAADREGVRERVAAVLPDHVPGPLTAVRIKLAVLSAVAHPALAQARLEVGWRVVRADVAAPTIAQAGRWLAARLAAQWRAALDRRPRAWPDPGRHLRPQPVPVPASERRLARRKTYRLARCAPGSGALRMDALDYTAHLFTDLDTGQDAVIYRSGPTGYRLARQTAQVPVLRPTVVPLTVSAHPVPVLTIEQAMARLGATDGAHLLFTDPDTGRGRLLYRRFDGHYGLVEPTP